MMDLFLTNTHLFTSQYINWWTGLLVVYCDVFISCLDSDGTHSLHRIHWWSISPNIFRWRNKPIYSLNGLKVSKCFIFGQTVPLILLTRKECLKLIDREWVQWFKNRLEEFDSMTKLTGWSEFMCEYWTDMIIFSEFGWSLQLHFEQASAYLWKHGASSQKCITIIKSWAFLHLE